MMRISRLAAAVLAAMLAAAVFVSCGSPLELKARSPITFQNFKTEAIEQITVQWDGYARDGFVLKQRDGSRVTVPAAPDEETPSKAVLQQSDYFPWSGGSLTFTAAFSGGSTESISTTNDTVKFAEPVAEVFSSSLRISNGYDSSIQGIALTREASETPGDEAEHAYVVGLGLPLSGIDPGGSYTVTLSSTSESKVEGQFYVYALLDGQDDYKESGPVSVSIGSTTEHTAQ